MRKYNISKPEKYMKDGQEKTYWANVGTLTEFEKQDGTVSRIIEIPAISLKASVFEQEERKTNPMPIDKEDEKFAQAQVQPQKIEYPAEEINPQDIPF